MKLPIPADWDGESWCRWAVCWPESEQWEGILRGFLTLPQRGWTWDERSGSILGVQQIGQEITALNLPLNGVLMACNDTEMVAAFTEIALAIRYLADNQPAPVPCPPAPAGGACCDDVTVIVNNTIQGTVTQPVGGNDIPIYGSEPPLTVPPGTFPPNYETEPAYLTDKCRAAHMIADGIILTLKGLGAITVFNVTALAGLIGLAMAGAIIFPPAAIPIMIAALITLAVEIGVLVTMGNEIEAHKDELICLLYEATGTEAALAVVADFLDFIIGLIGVSTPVGAGAKVIAMLLFNSDTVNQLFNGAAALGYPDADCSGCGSCEPFYWEFETGADDFGEVAVLPGCFGLTLNGSAGVAAADGILSVSVAGGAPNTNGAFGRTGVEYAVRDGAQFEVTLRLSGAGSVYVDAVMVFDDASCLWTTLSNNHGASGEFAGISVDMSAQAGKTVNEVYIFLSSQDAGGDASFLVEFEKIGFFCN